MLERGSERRLLLFADGQSVIRGALRVGCASNCRA